jgi:hypothetical protein
MLLAARWVFSVFVLTVVTIVFSAAVFVPLLYSRHRLAAPGVTSVLLLAGIWLSGPSLIVLALSLVSGRVPDPGFPGLSLVELLSPMSLVVASTYAGTLGALLVVSLWLGITALVYASLSVLRRTRRAI